MRKEFFASVKASLFSGKFSQAQVDGLNAILDGCDDLPRAHLAYLLATAYHETGGRMEAVREGFCKTDQGSRNAVARLYRKGVISTNYAKPINGLSYYGRGLVQLTWIDNYRTTGKALGLDLVKNPDLMLDLDVSVRAIKWGMITGSYRRGRSFATMLPENPSRTEVVKARDIINGDVRKNGPRIAVHYDKFYAALENLQPVVKSTCPTCGQSVPTKE